MPQYPADFGQVAAHRMHVGGRFGGAELVPNIHVEVVDRLGRPPHEGISLLDPEAVRAGPIGIPDRLEQRDHVAIALDDCNPPHGRA